MKLTRKTALRTIGILAALGVAMLVGYQAAGQLGASFSRQGAQFNTAEVAQKDMAYSGSAGAAAPEMAGSSLDAGVATTDELASTAVAPNAERVIISAASMSLRVDSLDDAISSVREIASASKSEISNLVMTSGELSPQPVPLAEESGVSEVSGPADAQITLRVPADSLSAVEQRVARLGLVLAQSASQDDVTQQHVDMKARLKNLQAEEATLRTFLRRTDKVSELLVVERELSRVRGDIESMQAQLQYLENQAAMATLTISLSEPGPVVSPGTGGWGLGQAVTDGVRVTAALLRALITLAIPLALITALGVLVAALWRTIRRRRTAAHTTTDAPEE